MTRASVPSDPAHLSQLFIDERQCIIEGDKGGLSVADIAGSLGTSVNGHRITRASQMPGNRLRVGRSNFTVQYEP